MAGSAWARPQMSKGYQFPAGEPVRIVILRPDVTVGSLTAGGVEEPNADWTAAARDNLAKALDDNQGRRGASVVAMPEVTGDDAKVVDDYQKLFRAVSQSIMLHKYLRIAKLPTKKDSFDWTLGPGAARLGQIGGANYALLLYTHDSFGTSGRKALQVVGMLGCAVYVCVIVKGGIHYCYASLVDLKSGDVVWFDYLPSSYGDIRHPDGAQAQIDRLLQSLPVQAKPAAAHS
jgi:hypothetical protein